MCSSPDLPPAPPPPAAPPPQPVETATRVRPSAELQQRRSLQGFTDILRSLRIPIQVPTGG